MGVRPRCKKSARKPSREMSTVVGAKSWVPFDNIFTAYEGDDLAMERDALYAPYANATKATRMMMCSAVNLLHLASFDED